MRVAAHRLPAAASTTSRGTSRRECSRTQSSACRGGRPRLAVGVATTRPFLPEEVGRLAQIEETAEALWPSPENHTSYPAPGAISETEFLLAYGGVRFASKVGQLAGNHFLTITEGRENLAALGKLTLWHGAQDVVFEQA